MVDCREVAVNISPQYIAEAVPEPLVTGNGTMRSLAAPVAIAVEDEAALEYRFDDRAECMMDNTVAERCLGSRISIVLYRPGR